MAWLTRGEAAAVLKLSGSAVQRRGIARTIETMRHTDGTKRYRLDLGAEDGERVRGEAAANDGHRVDGGGEQHPPRHDAGVYPRAEVRAQGAGEQQADPVGRGVAGDAIGEAAQEAVDEWEEKTPALLSSQDVQMWAVGSDVHVPDHDKRAWQGFLDFVADWRPHGVCINGDFAECQSFSSHGDLTEPGYWLQEREACRLELARLRRAAGSKARIVYNSGNHEGRIDRSIAHNAPTLAGLLTVRDQFRLDALDIEHRAEGDALRLGHLRVVHGRWCPINAAKTHVEKLGSCLVGHVHRPGMHATGYDGKTQIGWVAPCLRDLQANYLGGYDAASGWAHGFAIVHVWPDGRFTCELIVMDPERRFAYGGRLYGG